MSFKKNINIIKKNYSLGIIGGGQLALMLTEAAKKKRFRSMCSNKILW
jgi:5-(carboxyamino)imidazole ribonucleotide synthase